MSDLDLSRCYCNEGYNRPMIRCCNCHRWYHCDCVNATAKDMDDANHFYCFMCVDDKPKDESDEDYDFLEDIQRLKESNRETGKRVKVILQEHDFSPNTITSMNADEILRSICYIEQTLLLTDDSPSIHNSGSELNGHSFDDVDRRNRLELLKVNPPLQSICTEVERYNLYYRMLDLRSFLAAKDNHQVSRKQFVLDNDEWMMKGKYYIDENEIPPDSVAISADIRLFNWSHFGYVQRSLTGRLFDVVMIDPPWQLSSDNPSRGVAIKYQSLDDDTISSIPLEAIQSDGLLFMWVINCKFAAALRMLSKWGYRLVGDIAWVKLRNRGFVAQGNGFYLQHAKETCFVALKGYSSHIDTRRFGTISDVILAKRKGQSQKPEEIYDIIEKLVPNGFYCEIFGRLNNLRNNWVTIGNEIFCVCLRGAELVIFFFEGIHSLVIASFSFCFVK